MSTTLDFDADLASRIETIYATPDVNATRSEGLIMTLGWTSWMVSGPNNPDGPRGWGSFPARRSLSPAGDPPESTKDGATVYVVDIDGSSLKAIDN